MLIENLMGIARHFAEENMNAELHPAHLLRACLHKDMELVDFIETTLNQDYYYCVEWAEAQIEALPKSSKHGAIGISEASVSVISEAENNREHFGVAEADARCVLLALVTPGVGFSYEQLKTMPLTAQQIIDAAASSGKPSAQRQPSPSLAGKSLKALNKYCINRSAEARGGALPPVIGFEDEISTIFEVLGRKNKSNLLITGESGVGKTALLRAFVLRTIEGNAPERFKTSDIFELDLGALTAGSSYKGEVEDRAKSVIDELRQLDNAVLIIESIDKMFDKQDVLYGAVSVLKQELGRMGISLLCTASIDGYTKHIETDKEFVRKLDKITLEQPNEQHCFRILKGSIAPFIEYHGLEVSDEVLTEAIRLAKRYLSEKSLPDSAFDLIDRTMSQISTMNAIAKDDVADLCQRLASLQGADDASLATQLGWLHYEVFNKVSCLLTSQIDDDTDFAKIETTRAKRDYLQKVLDRLSRLAEARRTAVVAADLFAVVARQTGIPLGKVQSKERERLVNGEEILKRRVIGQDHAIRVVLDAIYESRSGLNKKGQPMGSFFFLGPTGTGKTELSKSLVEFLFGDEQSLIRFDMSEFKEEHSVALLYGAPPGYVGYEEGGLLVNKIRQNPYSVVLFDEIEKAHKSVFDLFLQILDEGRLHDRLGRVGDFSNALILFTSNIGSQYIVDSFNNGVVPKGNDLMDIMQGHFRPEFLGRLTEIVPFAPISEQTVVRIFDIHLRGLCRQLDEQHIALALDDDTKRAIAMSGFNPQYGARPVIGIIRKELRRPLSRLIIAGKVRSGDTVTAQWDGRQVGFAIN